MLAGLAFCGMLSQYPRSAFQGFCRGHQRGSAVVCNPNPPRPLARYRGNRRKLQILEGNRRFWHELISMNFLQLELHNPASTFIFKIRSGIARTDLKNKAFSADFVPI